MGEGKFVCVGLDSEFEKIPQSLKKDDGGPVTAFNKAIVAHTHDFVCAYKPNIAFYAGRGEAGLKALFRTIENIKDVASDVPIILDIKRADIGNTNHGYVKEAFDVFGADAVTVNPYFGAEALQPFLERAEKGVIVLCRTSNKGAREFQDLFVPNPLAGADISKVDEDMGPVIAPSTIPLYQRVAYNVAHDWNINSNCAVVAGATYPSELAEVRCIVGDLPILIPGIGKQGGDLEKTVSAGKDSNGQGMIINSSSGIIFASNGEDFAEAARLETEKLHSEITRILKGAVTA